MLFGEKLHTLAPWNRFKKFLIFLLQVVRVSELNIDESDYPFIPNGKLTVQMWWQI